MIHDDFKQWMKEQKVSEDMTEKLARAQGLQMPALPADDMNKMVDDAVDDAVPFSFSLKEGTDEELLKTFVNMTEHFGKLPMPYKNVVCVVSPEGLMSMGDGMTHLVFLSVGLTEQVSSVVAHARERDGSFYPVASMIHGLDNGVFRTDYRNIGTTLTQKQYAQIMGIFIDSIVKLSLKQYTQTTEQVPPKVAAKRMKSGKSFYQSYVVVELAQQYRSTSGTGKGGWTVRPHWRRGHTRRTRNGKVAWIDPVMVNMKGGGKKPVYEV